ncbi:MAG: hypothetical protein AB1Z23_11650 [Eubacteriales bacterium]
MKVKTLKSVQKNSMVALILGIIYFFMECIDRWVTSSLPNALFTDKSMQVATGSFTIHNTYHNINMTQSFASLTGWSSMWMVLVGGLCGIGIAAIAKAWWTDKWPIIAKASFGVIFVVWPLEFISGSILNNHFNLGIWDYGTWPFAIRGQITLAYFPVFLIVAILAIWIDEAARHWIMDEPRPIKFSSYLKKVFTFK